MLLILQRRWIHEVLVNKGPKALMIVFIKWLKLYYVKKYSSSNIWTVDVFLTIMSYEVHRHYDVSICMLKLLDTLLLAVTNYFLKLPSSLILRQ